MQRTLMKAMTNSIFEVMETMFFLLVELGPEIIFEKFKAGMDDLLLCRIAFTGDVSGTLFLACPVKLAEQMAQNFMGEPGKRLSRADLSGTLTEISNMVCGNALSKTRTIEPFELGLPEEISYPDMDDKAEFTLIEIMDSRMAFSLVLEKD